MSDWETTTMIGNRRTGAGAPQHAQTLRGNSAINAAKRTGGVTSEKKYTTGNLVCQKPPECRNTIKIHSNNNPRPPRQANPRASS